jgi:hypothetical protein
MVRFSSSLLFTPNPTQLTVLYTTLHLSSLEPDMVQQQQQHHPSMPLLTMAMVVLLAILMTTLSLATINMLPLHVDNPLPDGNGVVFIKLQANPTNPAVGDLAKFQITSLNFLDGQVLKMWDTTNNNCNSTALAVNDYGTLLMIIISIILSVFFFFFLI